MLFRKSLPNRLQRTAQRAAAEPERQAAFAKILAMQPTPSVTHKDVERIVSRDFALVAYRDILAVLSEYGEEPWHRETDRVRLAALKLAAGSIDGLRSAIEAAKRDYRDVLALAEYPEYSRSSGPSEKVSPNERQRIVDADWQQYREWLYRSSS